MGELRGQGGWKMKSSQTKHHYFKVADIGWLNCGPTDCQRKDATNINGE